MTQPFIKYYRELKDTLTTEDLKAEFNRLLDLADHGDALWMDICEALWELSDRQYHTYEEFDIETKKRVADWLTANWKTEYNFIKNVGMIAGVLGIKEAIPLLKQTSIDKSVSEKVRDEANIILHEIEPHIEDPYHDL